MYYIKNAMFDKLIPYVELLAPDCDVPKLLLSVGLSASELANVELFLDYPKVAKLLTLFAQELNQPLFAFLYARHVTESNMALMDKFLPLLKSLDMMYCFFEKYIHNQTNAVVIERHVIGDRVFLFWKIGFDNKNDDWFQVNLFSAIRTYQPLHKVISENFSDGTDVIIQLPEKYAYLYSNVCDYFSDKRHVPFVFKGEEYAISYPEKYNKKNFDVRPKELFGLIEDVSAISLVKSDRNFSNNVTEAIKNNINMERACNLTSIAKLFYMHPRTLQYKLSNENCKFADVLEQARKEVSLKMLSNDEMPIYMIAIKLGFSNSTVFSRAFKRWFNMSPSQWRKYNNEDLQ